MAATKRKPLRSEAATLAVLLTIHTGTTVSCVSVFFKNIIIVIIIATKKEIQGPISC